MSNTTLEATLKIENFKSIKSAELKLRPVTIFIGPPDSGKSNTLEALGLFTSLCYGGNFTQYFRTKMLHGIITDFGSYSEISIALPCLDPDIATYSEQLVVGANVYAKECECSVYVKDLGGLIWEVKELGSGEDDWTLSYYGPITFKAKERLREEKLQLQQAVLKRIIEQGLDIEPKASKTFHEDILLGTILCRIRFYRFQITGKSAEKPRIDCIEFIDKLRSVLRRSILWPPDGANIGELITYNKALRDIVNDIAKELGYERVTYVFYEKAPTGELVFEKSLSDGRSVLFSISAVAYGVIVVLLTFAALFSNLPEKLPRIVPDIIVLEEPEIHTFPYFTKRIAEAVAHVVETNNKFVILTTHNPYMFITLLEKVPLDKLAVYWVYKDNEGYTRYHMLSEDEIREAMSYGTEALFTIEDIVRERLETKKDTGSQ